MNDIKIISVFHKEYKYNKECQWITPISVGNFSGGYFFLSDKNGENISHLNYTYAELTALYWMWKNISVEYYGLCHYRRYFNFCNKSINSFEDFFSEDQNIAAINILKDYDVILSRPIQLNSSMESQYKECHVAEHYDIFIEEIKNLYPKNMNEINEINTIKTFYRCNCFVTNKNIFNKYCSELFYILNNVYSKINTNIDKPDKRHIGYLGERFLNIFFIINKYKIQTCEIIDI